MIHVADQDHAGVGWNGPEELVPQDDIDHGSFVQDEQVAGERVLLVPLELARGRIEFQ